MLNNPVSGDMPQAVVDPLKVIYIEHHQTGRIAIAGMAIKFPLHA